MTVRLNHIHVGVRDLSGALDWLHRAWEVTPVFRNERMAAFLFGDVTLILDLADSDSPATIGFESDDCDRDFDAVLRRGAVPIEVPSDRSWGVRSAYVRGPGLLVFEIETPLK